MGYLTIFESKFGSMDLNGFHIEYDFGSRLDNLDIDLDLSIVGPGAAELQVEQREVVMGRFYPDNSQSEALRPKQTKLNCWCKQWDM